MYLRERARNTDNDDSSRDVIDVYIGYFAG